MQMQDFNSNGKIIHCTSMSTIDIFCQPRLDKDNYWKPMLNINEEEYEDR